MRGLQKWSPMNDLWDLHDEVDRLFHGFGRQRFRGEDETDIAVWAPSVDIHEDKEAVTLTAELPGLRQKDVKISVEGGVLTFKGERKFQEERKKENFYRIERSYGSFCRSFTLPSTVEAEKIKANMKDGVLEIYIPKKEEAKPKEIEIEVK